MDFCLQANIEQALTLSFNQMQQDNCRSQPMTPSVLTAQIEQVELVQEISNRPECKEKILIKRSFVILILRFQSSAPVIHNESILISSSSSSSHPPLRSLQT